MIDMPHRRSLDFLHFVYRGTGSVVLLPASLLVVCALCTACGPAGKPLAKSVEDSQTSGRISVVVDPEIRALMDREVGAFRALYPEASIQVSDGTTRQAVTALFGSEADLAVVTRELEPEEREVKIKGGMELEGYRFAKDGTCIVVHPTNPLTQISAEDLRRIYLGAAQDWSALGGSGGRIEPVMPPVTSDRAVAFIQQVLGGQAPSAPALAAADDSTTIRTVLAHPGAIGFVSAAWADRGAKTLRVSMLRGLPAGTADPEAVYKGEYPLARTFNLYVRSTGPILANGLITFVTSIDGQKLVHDAGLVPIAVPVRFVRRSPMLSSH